MCSFSLCLTTALDEGWSTPSFGRFTPGKEPIPIVQEAGWAPMLVCTAAENLIFTGSPDRLARSESLYRLSHPGPRFSHMCCARYKRLAVNTSILTLILLMWRIW